MRRLSFDDAFESWRAVRDALARLDTSSAIVHGQLQLAHSDRAVKLKTLPADVESVASTRPINLARDFPELRELILVTSGWEEEPLVDSKSLSRLPSLEWLCLDPWPTHTYDLAALRGTELRGLMINAHSVPTFAPIRSLRALEELSVEGYKREQIGPSLPTESLRRVNLDYPRGIRSLAAAEGLRDVRLSDASIASLRGFSKWQRVERLHLSGRSVRGIDGITRLKALRRLILSDVGVRDLAPLAEHETLEEVTLLLPSKVADFEPLARIPSLRRLEVSFASEPFPPEVRQGLLNIGDARRDVEIVVPAPQPDDRTWIGRVGYRSLGEHARWSIFQDLTSLLNTDTNYAAESRIRRETKRRDAGLLDRLEFDSEADAVGIYAMNEIDIRSVAEIICALITD